MENVDKYNIIKGVSIFLVVCIHIVYIFFSKSSKPLFFEIYNYITGLAVPFFLILGGFFFSKKYLNNYKVNFTLDSFVKAIIGIFKRVVVPYYLFVLILTFYNYTNGNEIFWKHFLFIDSNEHGLYFLIIYTYSFVFSISLLYLLKGFRGKIIALTISILSLSFYIIVWKVDCSQSVVISQLPYISFFTFGALFYFLDSLVLIKKEQKMISVIVLSLIVIYTMGLYLMRKIIGPFPVFTSAPPTVFRLIYCVLFYWFFLCILSNIEVSSLLKKFHFDRFGVDSLFIFLIHPYLIKVAVPAIREIYSMLNLNYDNMFLFVVIVLAYLITFISHFIYKLLPNQIMAIFSR